MWVDERGSEVLGVTECHRRLALGAKLGLHGHLGVATGGAPSVLPVNYRWRDGDIVVRIGDGLFDRVMREGVVAFEVDGEESGRRWSVLVRGLATEEHADDVADLPEPEVAEPGHRLVRIRADVITGRVLAS